MLGLKTSKLFFQYQAFNIINYKYLCTINIVNLGLLNICLSSKNYTIIDQSIFFYMDSDL